MTLLGQSAHVPHHPPHSRTIQISSVPPSHSTQLSTYSSLTAYHPNLSPTFPSSTHFSSHHSHSLGTPSEPRHISHMPQQPSVYASVPAQSMSPTRSSTRSSIPYVRPVSHAAVLPHTIPTPSSSNTNPAQVSATSYRPTLSVPRPSVATAVPFKQPTHPHWSQSQNHIRSVSRPHTVPQSHHAHQPQPQQPRVDPNPPRTCANCGCTETPLWRRSPLGPKTVCNACGVRMKKGKLIFVDATRTFVTLPPNPHPRRQNQNISSASPKHLHPATVTATAASSKSTSSAHSGSSSGASSSATSSRTAAPKSIDRKRRPRPSGNVSGTSVGLYYLLAAIDHVETAWPNANSANPDSEPRL